MVTACGVIRWDQGNPRARHACGVPKGSLLARFPFREAQHSPHLALGAHPPGSARRKGCLTLHATLGGASVRFWSCRLRSSFFSDTDTCTPRPPALHGKPLPAAGVSTRFCPPPPFPRYRVSGVGRLSPCTQGQASPEPRLRPSRAHLGTAALPPCPCPGRPRPSGGGPPAAGPGPGGPAQHPAGGFPCGGAREGQLGTREGRPVWSVPGLLSRLVPVSPRLTQAHQVPTLLGPARPARTAGAGSPPAPSAAAGPPSGRSRRRPTAPAGHGGLGEGVSAGRSGTSRTRPPGARVAGPPPRRPWRRPQQPGVRDRPAGLLSAGATASGRSGLGD